MIGEGALKFKENFVSVPGGNVYTKLYDPARRLFGFRLGRIKKALVMIHGGPGYPHNYLENLSVVSDLIPVLFYDQLGCGKSERVQDTTLWNVKRFVEELESIRVFYKVDQLILHGHSWGSIVALEYALKFPERVSGIVMESPCVSIPLWKRDSERLLEQLSVENQKIVEETKRNYRFGNHDFVLAVDEYYRKFVHHERPKPPVLQYCDMQACSEVYTTMWGPCEFILSGSLAPYDRSEELKNISLPVLFTAGEHDEVLPETLSVYESFCQNARTIVLENSRHFPHMDASEDYEALLREFLSKIM